MKKLHFSLKILQVSPFVKVYGLLPCRTVIQPIKKNAVIVSAGLVTVHS